MFDHPPISRASRPTHTVKEQTRLAKARIGACARVADDKTRKADGHDGHTVPSYPVTGRGRGADGCGYIMKRGGPSIESMVKETAKTKRTFKTSY